MNVLLYIILLCIPLPLIFGLVKSKHYLRCITPFIALSGVYLFIIIGSLKVITNAELFSYRFYYSLIILEILFYLFYFLQFSMGEKIYLDWSRVKQASLSSNILFMSFLWFWSFLLLALYYSRHGLPIIFDVSFLEYTDIYALRAEKLTNLPEGAHWYNLGFIGIPTFLIIYSYVLKVRSHDIAYKNIYYMNLLLGLFMMSLNATKGQFVYLLADFFIISLFIQGRKFNLKRLVLFFTGGLALVTALIRVYLLDRPFGDVVLLVPSFLFKRIFVVYSEAHAYVTHIFPQQHDYFHGYTFANPAGFLPYEPVNIAQFLGAWIDDAGVQNYSPPSFSEGYANFGFPGFILIVLLMFLQIFIIQMIFKKCPKNALFLAFYILVAEKMLHYAIEPIQEVLPELFIFFCLVLIAVYYTSQYAVRFVKNEIMRPLGKAQLREHLPSSNNPAT